MSSIIQSGMKNAILAAMTADDFGLLKPDLEFVAYPLATILVHPNVPNDHVHFLESGLASQIAFAPNRRRLEVGIYGRDGVGPSANILGIDRSPHQDLIQVKADGFRIPAPAFAIAMARSRSLHALLLRYLQAFTVQVAYTALSNGNNVIGERLARWLLMCHDRLEGDELPITQQFLGVMLGVRRAGVSDAIRMLERAEVIRSIRGRILLLDRARLEVAAMGSYGVPEAEYQRLFGPAL